VVLPLAHVRRPGTSHQHGPTLQARQCVPHLPHHRYTHTAHSLGRAGEYDGRACARSDVHISAIAVVKRLVARAQVDLGKLAVAVPASLHAEWCARFGTDGLPPATRLLPCAVCEVRGNCPRTPSAPSMCVVHILTGCGRCPPLPQAEERALAERRQRESDDVARLDSTSIADGEHWYLIASAWLRLWTDFKRGGTPPGPIDNAVLLDADGQPRRFLQKGTAIRGGPGRGVVRLPSHVGALGLCGRTSSMGGCAQCKTTAASTSGCGSTLRACTAAGRSSSVPRWISIRRR
jgi:hypothetical protein